MPDPTPPPRSSPSAPPVTVAGGTLATAAVLLIAIVCFYYGREIFIPFALGILLSFVLAPLVLGLRRLRIPRIVAVLLAVSFAFIAVGALSLVVGQQLVQLADNLPSYQTTIREKIRSLRSSTGSGGAVEKVTDTLKDLGQELAAGQEKPQAESPVARRTPDQPLRVTVEPPPAQPLDIIWTIIGPLLAPVATAGIVVVFVIFILLEQEDLRDRFIRLVGTGDLHRSTEALNEAAQRVSRYLLMQLIVNLTYGIPIGVGLYFIGVPNALLWGLLAAVLRFVPYLGPFLAALFPLALAFAVDPGWTMLIWTAVLFVGMELVSNNAVEPWLYGASTGISSLAIILAAIFWTTLWGPVGLFLSTPLTVCLVVMGRYVPRLEFLGVLLGSDPVLAPEERLYQRLLSGNLEEAVEIGENYAEEKSALSFYDEVGLPALRLAENDRQRGVSDAAYRRIVAEGVIQVAAEVADHEKSRPAAKEGNADEDAEETLGRGASQLSILCIAGRSELDRAAADMLALALRARGIASTVVPPVMASREGIGGIDLVEAEIVCLSYIHPSPQVYARYVCRRLKRRAPGLKILVGCWNLTAEPTNPDEFAASLGAEAVAISLAAATERLRLWSEQPSQPAPPAGPKTKPALKINSQDLQQ